MKWRGKGWDEMEESYLRHVWMIIGGRKGKVKGCELFYFFIYFGGCGAGVWGEIKEETH